MERGLAQPSSILFLSQKSSVHKRIPKLGLASSVGSPPKPLKVANSVSNSGSKTESTILKREDLETQSHVKQQALISKRESGSRFLNLPRPDWAETEGMLFPDDLSRVPTPNKGVQKEDI